MAQQKTIQKDLTILLSITFVIVVLWIGLTIYHTYVTSTISDTLATQIIPINPNFDKKTIQSLRIRAVITPIYSLSTQQTGTVSAIPPVTNVAATASALPRKPQPGGLAR